jgi:predicted N-acetyltransferase YhbS
MWPNKAADPRRTHILEETIPLFVHHWTEARQQSWFLDVLATHPDYQGQGLGRQLVMWGAKRAREEKICASVVSALGKDVFYGRCGFVEVGRANVGALAECGLKGGAIMFCEGHLS